MTEQVKAHANAGITAVVMLRPASYSARFGAMTSRPPAPFIGVTSPAFSMASISRAARL